MSHPKIKPTPKHVSFFKEHKLDLVATVAAFISLIILFVDNIKYGDKKTPQAMVTVRNISFYVFVCVMFYVVFRVGRYMLNHTKMSRNITVGVIVASVIFLLCGIYIFTYHYNMDPEKITIQDKILYWTCIVYMTLYIGTILAIVRVHG